MIKVMAIIGLLLGGGVIYYYTLDDNKGIVLLESNDKSDLNSINIIDNNISQNDIESMQSSEYKSELSSEDINSTPENDRIEFTDLENKNNLNEMVNEVVLAVNPDEFGNERVDIDESQGVIIGEFESVMTPEIELSEKAFQETVFSDNENNAALIDELLLESSAVELTERNEIGEVMSVDVLPDSTSTEPNEIGSYMPIDQI